MNIPPEIQALDRAATVLGGLYGLARAIGVSQGTPGMWRRRGKVGAEFCPAIERETRKKGATVYCEELCPLVDWQEVRKHRRPAAVLAPIAE